MASYGFMTSSTGGGNRRKSYQPTPQDPYAGTIPGGDGTLTGGLTRQQMTGGAPTGNTIGSYTPAPFSPGADPGNSVLIVVPMPGPNLHRVLPMGVPDCRSHRLRIRVPLQTPWATTPMPELETQARVETCLRPCLHHSINLEWELRHSTLLGRELHPSISLGQTPCRHTLHIRVKAQPLTFRCRRDFRTP